MRQSLDMILAEADAPECRSEESRRGGSVAFWLKPEYKERYEELQHRTGRRFGRKIRRIIQAAIDEASSRIQP